MANTADATASAEGAPLVLVIDDDADARTICDRALVAAGYRTAVAASGAAGLAQLAAVRPDLVVLDLAMPDTDGFAVADAIRRSPQGATLPILVLTGLTREAARAAGGTIVCQKPVEPQRLLTLVRRLCPLTKGAR